MGKKKSGKKVGKVEFIDAYIKAKSLEGLKTTTGLTLDEIKTKISQCRQDKIKVPTLIERGWEESGRGGKKVDVAELNAKLEKAGLVGKLITRKTD